MRGSELCLGTGAAQLEAPTVAASAQGRGMSEVCRLTPTLGPAPCGVAVLCGTALPGDHLLSGGERPVPSPLCKVQLKSPAANEEI